MCVGCGSCVQKCPLKCISLRTDEEGFYYPYVNTKKCVDCGKCESVCPCINSLKQFKEKIDVWCVKHKDNVVRFNSSSGGVFSALAECIIHQNGVVVGVTMSNNCKLAEHIVVQSYEDIKKIRGSKYLQSNIGDIYLRTEKYLEQGKKVLFSGTPCQIKGLKLFLNKDFDNLVCVDVICHGVPSQKLWAKYIEYLQEKLKSRIINVNFRSKKYGWLDFETKYWDNQEHQYFRFNFEDPYFRMFNSVFCLRPSCYQCQAKDGKSGADITLGDFWNIETIHPIFNDSKGLSMVLLNSNKGKRLFEEVKENFYSINKGLNYELAKKCNPAIYKSQSYHPARDIFYKDMNKLSFKKLSKKYTPKTLKIILKGVLLKAGVWDCIKKCLGEGITDSYGMLLTYKKWKKVE